MAVPNEAVQIHQWMFLLLWIHDEKEFSCAICRTGIDCKSL